MVFGAASTNWLINVNRRKWSIILHQNNYLIFLISFMLICIHVNKAWIIFYFVTSDIYQYFLKLLCELFYPCDISSGATLSTEHTPFCHYRKVHYLSVNNVKRSEMFSRFIWCLWCASATLWIQGKSRTMDESNEALRVVPGESFASKSSCKLWVFNHRGRTNGSFPGYRALLSDSEISLGWTPEGDCKGKFNGNTSEYYFSEDKVTQCDLFCCRPC